MGEGARLAFDGATVTLTNGRRLEGRAAVIDAREFAGGALVLYDPAAGPRHRQFRNLDAFAADGALRWTADQPTSETADGYVAIASTDPLVADSFGGFRATLDPATGRVLDRLWTK